MMNANEKRLYQVIVIGFIMLSIPIIILSFYNVPCADDYTFGKLMYFWVNENGYNPFGMLKCAVQNVVDYYFSWQGRYSESFFASFMPDIYGCYWLWTIFLYLFFCAAVVSFFRVLAKGLGGDRFALQGTCIGLIVSTAITQNIPFPVEAFFWFDGSMAYMFHHTLYLFMCTMVLRYFFEKDEKIVNRYLVLAVILTLFVAGGNNVTAFVSILTYCVFVAIVFLVRKKWGIFIPFVLSICGFAVSYLSPGTVIRGGDSSNYTPILLAIRKCFVWTIKQYLFKWMLPGIILMLIFLTPVLLKLVEKVIQRYHFKFPVPLLVGIGVVCLLSAMSCPAFYVLGEPGPGRMRNIIFVNYVILLVLGYGYILGWIMAKGYGTEKLTWLSEIYQTKSTIFHICSVIVVLGMLSIGNFKHPGVSVEAVRELVTGEASVYYEEARVREMIYLDETIEEAEVEPYSIKPYLLFFDDITDDMDNWKNIAVAEYYGKKNVKLNEYDPEVDYD